MWCPLLMRRSIILSRLIAYMGCTRVCALSFGPCMIYERQNFNLTCRPQKRPWGGSKLTTTTTTPAERSHDSAKISPGSWLAPYDRGCPGGGDIFLKCFSEKWKKTFLRPRGWFIGSELIGKCVCVCWAASEFELDFFEGAVKLMAKRSLFGPLLFMFDPWGHFQQQQQYGQVHSVLVFFFCFCNPPSMVELEWTKWSSVKMSFFALIHSGTVANWVEATGLNDSIGNLSSVRFLRIQQLRF